MSVCSVIESKSGREFLGARVGRPLSPAPRIENVVEPIAPDAQRIGTAFDYAVRFGLEARGWGTHEHAPLAAAAVSHLRRGSPLHAIAEQRCVAAWDVLRRLEPGVRLSAAAATACLDFAGLDIIFRARITDQVERVASVDEIEELQWLYRIVPWELFQPAEELILNPTFGLGSRLAGGADADLFLDGALIDIKVTKEPLIEARYLRQAVCYAALAERHGISNVAKRVDAVGFYLARAGQLVRLGLDELAGATQRREIADYLCGSA